MTERHAQLVALAKQMILECVQDGADPYMITMRYTAKMAALRMEWTHRISRRLSKPVAEKVKA